MFFIWLSIVVMFLVLFFVLESIRDISVRKKSQYYLRNLNGISDEEWNSLREAGYFGGNEGTPEGIDRADKSGECPQGQQSSRGVCI